MAGSVTRGENHCYSPTIRQDLPIRDRRIDARFGWVRKQRFRLLPLFLRQGHQPLRQTRLVHLNQRLSALYIRLLLFMGQHFDFMRRLQDNIRQTSDMVDVLMGDDYLVKPVERDTCPSHRFTDLLQWPENPASTSTTVSSSQVSVG